MTIALGVWRVGQKPPLFDPIKERETFLEARREFMEPGTSSTQIPQGIHRNNDSIIRGENVDQGTLRNFLESFLKLVHD